MDRDHSGSHIPMRNRSAAIDHTTWPVVRCCIPFLLRGTSDHSHSMVPIDGNLLIFLRKNFLYPRDSRQPNRSLSGPFDSKGEFSVRGKPSLSGTIGVDRTISRIHRRNGSYRRDGKLPSASSAHPAICFTCRMTRGTCALRLRHDVEAPPVSE